MLHHLTIYRLRTVRMKDDNRMALVEHGKKSVKFGCAKILSLHIRCQFYAIGSKSIESILHLTDCCINIRQRQSSTEQKSARMLLFDARSSLVGFPNDMG